MNPLLHKLFWLNEHQATAALSDLMRYQVALDDFRGLVANSCIPAYIRLLSPCPLKLSEPADMPRGIKPLLHGFYPAEDLWQLQLRGQGRHEIERLSLEAKARAKSLLVDPGGLWLAGIGDKQGLVGQLYFELRPGLGASSGPVAFTRHRAYANPERPKHREEDYVAAPRLPRDAVLVYYRPAIEQFARQSRQQLRSATAADRPLGADLRVWRTLSLMLFALVSQRQPYEQLGDVAALAMRTQERLAKAGIRIRHPDLLGCLLFAQTQLRPDRLSAAQVKLGTLSQPKIAIVYGVILDLAVGLHGHNPGAERSPTTSTIVKNIDALGLGVSRSDDAVREHLDIASSQRWPADIQRLAQRPPKAA